jgi:hypothetical protein
MQEEAVDILPLELFHDGCTAREWTIRWWRWLISIPRDQSPAFDSTGCNSDLYQIYPEVFFLCQTVGNSKCQLLRKTMVPRNKLLFMPIINWISISGIDGESVEELNSVAKKKIDSVTDLEFSINGQVVNGLHKYRISAPLFEVIFPKDNVLDVPPGLRRCVSDGYWMFLRPIKENIILSSFGACSSRANKIGITYEIIVL